MIGAVQPSDFADPSPKEVIRLIEQIRKEKVPAVFGSEVFPSPVLEQIAREAKCRYIDKLRDDELPGKPGEARHSYIGMKLRPNLLSQLKPGSRVVSHSFDMGDWKPDKVERVEGRTIYLWIIPAKTR